MRFFFIILSFLIIGSSFSQGNKKIALVLSGGGAKGFAHIGVLRSMEEAGLRPDIIVGTSMGAIIGGLYAIGYSVDEIDSIARSQNWAELLSNKIPLDELNFENKYYNERFQLSIPIKKGKITMPSGLIEGKKLQALLSGLTFRIQHIKKFEDFPIAFNCVGTNIETGDTKYFQYGDLAKSLRASMALPTAFSPVEIDGELFIDGGIVDNMPVERAKEMGANYIIAVNVGSGYDTGEKVNSMINTLLQAAFLVGLSKLDEQIEMTDLYIEPDISGLSTSSFGEVDKIIERGDKIGQVNLEKFKELAFLNENEGEQVYHTLEKRFVIDSIRLESNEIINRRMRKFLLGKLDVSDGDTITRSIMDKGLTHLRTTDMLLNVFYNISEEEGKTHLDLNIIQKPKAYFGATINYNVYQSIGLTVGINSQNLLSQASKIRFLARISENPKVNFSILTYLGKKQHLGYLLNLDYTFNKIPIYENGNKVSLYNYHYLDGQTGFLTTQSTKYAFGITGGYRFIDVKANVLDDTLTSYIKSIQSNFVYGKLFYEFNTLNSRIIPTKGLRINLTYEQNILNWTVIKRAKNENTINDSVYSQIGNDFKLADGYQKLSFELEYIPMFHKVVSGVFGVEARSVFSQKLGRADKYFVGGFEAVTPYHIKFWGLNYLKGGGVYNFVNSTIGLRIQAFKNFFITTLFNYMVYHDPSDRLYWDTLFSGEKLKTFNIFGGGLELAYQTIIGPIKAGIGYANGNKNVSLYVGVGFGF